MGIGYFFLCFYKKSQTLQTHTQAHIRSEVLFWTEIFFPTPVALSRIALMCPLSLLVWICVNSVSPCSGLCDSWANLPAWLNLPHFQQILPSMERAMFWRERGELIWELHPCFKRCPCHLHCETPGLKIRIPWKFVIYISKYISIFLFFF